MNQDKDALKSIESKLRKKAGKDLEEIIRWLPATTEQHKVTWLAAMEELRLRNSYTLTDVIKQPSRSAWREIIDDLVFSKFFKTKKALKELGLTMVSWVPTIVPHELIHAGVNKLYGGENKEIVINTLYGGQLWEKLIPGIESRVLFPFFGGYVKPGDFHSLAHQLATYTSPYLLTSLGIYSVLKGKEKDSLYWKVAGSGLIGGHAGGIIGDWFRAGTAIITRSVHGMMDLLEINPPIDDSTLWAVSIIPGFYVGSKLMSFSYRCMKGGINSARNYFKRD